MPIPPMIKRSTSTSRSWSLRSPRHTEKIKIHTGTLDLMMVYVVTEMKRKAWLLSATSAAVAAAVSMIARPDAVVQLSVGVGRAHTANATQARQLLSAKCVVVINNGYDRPYSEKSHLL